MSLPYTARGHTRKLAIILKESDTEDTSRVKLKAIIKLIFFSCPTKYTANYQDLLYWHFG